MTGRGKLILFDRSWSLYPPAGEINFNIVGVMFQLSSIVTESIRLVLVQILLQVRAQRQWCFWVFV